MRIFWTYTLCILLIPLTGIGQILQPIPLSGHDSAMLDKHLLNAHEELQKQRLKEASQCFNDAAMLYWEHNRFDKAAAFYKESLRLNLELGNENGIAMINSNLALLYADMQQFEASLKFFESTYSIRKAKGQKVGTISALINMSVVLNNLKRHNQAISNLKEALDIAREMSDAEQMKSCYGMLSETYEKAGIADTAFYYFNLYRSFHEMIQNQIVNKSKEELKEQRVKTELAVAREQHKELLLLRSKLAIEQKDSVILEAGNERDVLKENLTKKELQLQVTMQEAEINALKAENEIEARRRVTIIVSSALGVFTILLIFMAFAFLQKRKSNRLLSLANITINRKHHELQIRNREIIDQRDQISEQKEKIESINTELTDSIHYAKYIQQAVLPTKEELLACFTDYFILFKPKDIVSGDFYWTGMVNGKIVIAVGDCTGHGVPGAFMSILGMTLLNEIVIEKSITNTAVILGSLRTEIISSLHQKGHVGEQQDGMDISVCTIDKETNTLEYSGANNPIYISRLISLPPVSGAIPTENHDHTIYEIKGDRMPISIYDKMDPFLNHSVKIYSGDCIYLFSDGYADQFGGEDGKKFKYKSFKKLLLDNQTKSIADQKDLLDQVFVEWKGDNPQIDDIIVFGVRI